MILVNLTLYGLPTNGALEVAVPHVWQTVYAAEFSISVTDGDTATVIGEASASIPPGSVGFWCLNLRFVSGAATMDAVFVAKP